jgi:hypothetical protein
VREDAVAETEAARLIRRHEHLGSGCWGSINVDRWLLRACDRRSGRIVMLTEHLASPVLADPGSSAYAYVTLEWVRQSETDGATPRLHVYRVAPDGTQREQLDTQPLPPATVGLELVRWSPDGAWLELRLWDGTEGGWSAVRLRTDGSGRYEPLGAAPRAGPAAPGKRATPAHRLSYPLSLRPVGPIIPLRGCCSLAASQ